MKSILTLLAITAAAFPPIGCSHSRPLSPVPVATFSPRIAATSNPESPIRHVKELVTHVIDRDRYGFQIMVDNIQQHDNPRGYTCDCDYWVYSGMTTVCDYTASATVDLHARTVKFNHTRKHWCQGNPDNP